MAQEEDITNQQLLGDLTGQLDVIAGNMVVRKDVEEIVEKKVQEAVKGLATKEELEETTRGLATKEELEEAVKKLATKNELNAGLDLVKGELTSVIGQLESKIGRNQEANIKHHLETRKEIGRLNKRLDMSEGLAQAAGVA